MNYYIRFVKSINMINTIVIISQTWRDWIALQVRLLIATVQLGSFFYPE